MDKYRKSFNVFEQIEYVKIILQPVFENTNSFEIRGSIMRCVRYKLGIIDKISILDTQTYEILLKHKLNPKTVYEWLLLEDVPQHIKEKLVSRKINLQNARRQYVQWKRMSNTRAGIEIMEEMKNIMGRLRWKSQEGL